MSRKMTRRKVWPLMNPVALAMTGAQSFKSAGDGALIVEARNHAAMLALTNGTATKDDMQVLTNVLNMAVALAHQGFAAPHEEDFRAGSKAIEAIVARAKEKGRILATGPEIKALNWMLEIHEAQLEVVSVGEIDKANRYIAAVVRSGGSTALDLGGLNGIAA